jgi:hypothetical protein
MENGGFISLNLRHGWLLLLGIVDHRKRTVYEDIFKELEAIAMKDERLLDAFTQWQELSLSDEQYFAYEGRLKRILDEEAAVIEVKLREEEAVYNSRKATAKVLWLNGDGS